MAATATQASAERTADTHVSISDIPTVASYGEHGEAFDFDVFIIGGGSGGLRNAKALHNADPNIKIGIAESRELGGTCVNRGCNPKKTLVRASAFQTEIEEAQAQGIWKVSAELQWSNLQAWRKFKVDWVSNFYGDNLRARYPRITVFNTSASVKGQHEVQVGQETKTVRLLVLATGGKPRRMEFEGSNLPRVITSDEALELPNKPKSMLVVGGGYIAVELASFFLQVGTNVTMAVRSTMLKSFDEDIIDIVEDSLIHRGAEILSGSTKMPKKIVDAGDMLKVEFGDGTMREVEYVLQHILHIHGGLLANILCRKTPATDVPAMHSAF